MSEPAYSIQVCESQQQLFHPEFADQLAEARKRIDPILVAHLKKIGFPDDYFPLIKGWDYFVDSTIRYGVLPIRLPMEGDVVNHNVSPELLENMHPAVIKRFQEQQIEHFQFPFYLFTRGEDWWHGDKMFLVNDADSYLIHLQYEMGIRDEAVRRYQGKRGRGRPIDLAKKQEKERKSEKYRQWVEDCRAYKAEVMELTEQVNTLEVSTRAEVELIEAEAKDKVDHLNSIVERRKAQLAALKYKGAPKWVA